MTSRPTCGSAINVASAARLPSAFTPPRDSGHLRRYATNIGPIPSFAKPLDTTFTNSNGCSTMFRAAIPADQRAGGVVAYSSGNHAQGVAAAAQLLGMPCVIVMPTDAPRAKRERTAAFGAEIILYDRLRDDRETIAAEIAARRGATL